MGLFRFLPLAVVILLVVTPASGWDLFNKAKNVAKKVGNTVASGAKKVVQGAKSVVQNVIAAVNNPFPERDPSPISEIDPTFYFYPGRGRNTTINYRQINTRYLRINKPSLLRKFNPNYPTVFIIHGYQSNAFKEDFQELKDEYIKKLGLKANIFMVDWNKGAKMDYMSSVANTRVVGRTIANMINVLKKREDADLKTFHLIGHSLGAHTAGYAGQFTRGKVGRITGLDPAGPGFEKHAFNQKLKIGPNKRLDNTDAQFVDAIHTDAESSFGKFGFGIRKRVGDVDFYVNRGNDQPGCPKRAIAGKLLLSITTSFYAKKFSTEKMSCSHSRATRLFISSLRCDFPASKCATPRVARGKAKNGKCSKSKQMMGYHANSYLKGSFLVITGDMKPNFCPNGYTPQTSLSLLKMGKLMALREAAKAKAAAIAVTRAAAARVKAAAARAAARARAAVRAAVAKAAAARAAAARTAAAARAAVRAAAAKAKAVAARARAAVARARAAAAARARAAVRAARARAAAVRAAAVRAAAKAKAAAAKAAAKLRAAANRFKGFFSRRRRRRRGWGKK